MTVRSIRFLATLGPFALLLLLAPPATGAANSSVSPDVYGWSEAARTQTAGASFLVWSPDGSLAVEATGLNLDVTAMSLYGDLPARIPRLLNETLAPIQDLYPVPISLWSGEFTPNGTWFVAVFSVPPTAPFRSNSPELNNTTFHFAIWRTDTWTSIEDRIIATYASLDNGNASSLALFFDISPTGDRILLWWMGLEAPHGYGLQLRTFPGLANLSNASFSQTVQEARWSPSGSLVAVTFGSTAPIGEVRLLSGSDLTAIRSLTEANTWFTDISWSPDGQLVMVKATHYFQFFSGCSALWIPVNVSFRAYPTASLGSPRVVWSVDATSEPCGLYWQDPWLGTNGSASAVFHQTEGYVLVSYAGNVSVVNSTYWDTVFEANLSLTEFGADHASWLGHSMSFSYTTISFSAPAPPNGWTYSVALDRAVYAGFSWIPSAIFGMTGPNASADLYPAEPTGGWELSVTVDSVARVYESVTLSGTAPGASFNITMDVLSGELRQGAGGADIALVSWTTSRGWDGRTGEFILTLLASWNVSTEGAWALSGFASLVDGRSVPVATTGALSTHVEVELVGPLTVFDASRGQLAADAFVNATPTLSFGWQFARFVHAQHPLALAGFAVFVNGASGAPASGPLSSGGAGTLTATFSFSGAFASMRLALSHASGHAIDRTIVGLPLRIDRTGPALLFGTPDDGNWTAGFAVNVSFDTSDLEGGISLDGAVVEISVIGGGATFGSFAATASSGAQGSGFARFGAAAALPPGAGGPVTLRVSAFDALGNPSETTFTIFIDRAPPDIVFPDLPPWISATAFQMGWSCDDLGVGFDTREQIIDYRTSPTADRQIVLVQVDPSVPGHLALRATVALAEGVAGTVQAGCVDALGNARFSTIKGVYVDRTAPVLTDRSPTAGAILAGTAQNVTLWLADNLSGVRQNAVRCALSTDAGASYSAATGGTVKALPNGTFEAVCHVALAEGRGNRLKVLATDLANNTATFEPWELRVNVPPSVSIETPEKNSTRNGLLLRLTASVADEDDDVVTIEWIDLSTGQRLGVGTSITVSVEPGQHSVEIRVSDSAGHTASDRVTVLVLRPTEALGDLTPLWAAAIIIISFVAVGALLWRRASSADNDESDDDAT